MTVALFLELLQILEAMGGAGVAFIKIRKDIDARIAAGTLKPEDPFPPEHMAVVQHRVQEGLWASDEAWNANHANAGG